MGKSPGQPDDDGNDADGVFVLMNTDQVTGEDGDENTDEEPTPKDDFESEGFNIRRLRTLLEMGLSQGTVGPQFLAPMGLVISQIERIEETAPNTFDPNKVALLKRRLAHSRDMRKVATTSAGGIAAQVNETLEGETSSGPARLEKDLASTAGKPPPLKMKYGPVSFWKRRTVQAIAALGLIGVIGGSAYKIWEQLQASPDETEEAIKVANPTPAPTPTVVEEITEESPAATLYDEVGNKLETKTEGTGLSQSTKARIHAASTNDLTESLYDGVKQWETLDGKWLDTPEAHVNVVKKLTTWGGYKDVLTVSTNAHSIDEMLEDIANSELPHSELVAWKVATQIATIQGPEVVPSVEKVQTSVDTVTPVTIDRTLDENIQNPPPVPGPSFFADQEASQTGSLDSSLYDAPEPVSFLAKATIVETQAPTAVLVEEVEEVIIPAPRFEDRFDAVEPAHVKPVVQAKPVVPVFMDPTEAAEPVTLLAKREAEIPDVTEFMEEDTIPPPAPKPVPTLLENAKSAFSGLTSRFKSWLS